MPVRAGRHGEYETLHPTTEWQLMKTALTKDDFEVPTGLSCIDVSKQ